MGFFFNNFVNMYLNMQQQAPMMGGQAPTLDQLMRALFYNIHFILLLIIPAVTMASFSEEKKSHTMRLLMTAPATSLEIVLGKFLASLLLMTLVLLSSLAFPLFAVQYGNPDKSVLLTSYFGIFLLVISQISFGIWISSLTSNQFLAFLFTMFGLFMLLILNWMASALTGGGLAETVLKYIASSDHLDAFLKGSLSVSHVAYFLCFTATFLFLTNVSIDSQRW